jgi:ankyrin repeat protein
MNILCIFTAISSFSAVALATSQDLIKASREGNSAVVRQLLAAGVDPTTDKNAAIRYASEYGFVEVVKALLEHKDKDGNLVVDPAAGDSYAIRLASENGHLEVVQLLLDYKDRDGHLVVNPAALDNYAIIVASMDGHVAVVQVLLDHKDKDGNPVVDPAAKDNRAIRLASQSGRVKVVKMLLEHKDKDGNPVVDPAADNNYAIRLASEYGHVAVVQVLLDYKDKDGNPVVDPAAMNNYAIRRASKGGHIGIVKILLRHPRVSSSLTLMGIDSLFHTLSNFFPSGHVQTCLFKVFACKYPELNDWSKQFIFDNFYLYPDNHEAGINDGSSAYYFKLSKFKETNVKEKCTELANSGYGNVAEFIKGWNLCLRKFRILFKESALDLSMIPLFCESCIDANGVNP